MAEFIYINGRHYRSSHALISVNDAGFLYGDGLYETLRGYSGNLFAFDMHLERLFSSMQQLGYNPDFNREDIKNATHKLLSANGLLNADSYIKIIVTRNSYEKRFAFSYSIKPCLVIIARTLTPYAAEFYENGIDVFSTSIRRPAVGNDMYRHKLLSYFENIYAKNEAYSNQAQEAFFMTRDRAILEGASSNIFMVKDSKVFTTPLSQNILPGITRKTVIDICRDYKIAISEKRLHYYNLMEADEIFITSAIMEIMPVRKVDSHKISNAKMPGTVTKTISDIYKSKTSLQGLLKNYEVI